MEGTAVSPTTLCNEDSTYWGYATRLEPSIDTIFAECPHEVGYNLKIGTSKRVDASIDDPGFRLSRSRRKDGEKSRDGHGGSNNGSCSFDHVLIVFGGLAGINESVNADESMALPGEDSRKLFDVWVNVCPHQGSRTICTKEALFIALVRLSPFIARDGHPSGGTMMQSKGGVGKKKGPVAKTEDVEFGNEAVSKESSNEG